MPFHKTRRKISDGDQTRCRCINIGIAAACVLVGYLIAVFSDPAQETFQELKEIQSIVSEVGDVKSMDELKEKVRSNPDIFDKVTPSMVDKIKSNPLIYEEIEQRMGELK